jgi:hypothetical protein
VTGVIDQDGKDLKRLALQLDLETCPALLARFQLELQDAELEIPAGGLVVCMIGCQ